jgi:hypothetical protein
MTVPIVPVPVIADVISATMDRRRASAGITACATRMSDFSSELEMQLTGIAMVPEARDLMTSTLTDYWRDQAASASAALTAREVAGREVIIGAGYHAAVYAACRAAMGYPRPVVLERNAPEAVGGAFAVSMQPVFRLNSRNRPGPAGLPDQGRALNALPGGLLQPAMTGSEEYGTNASMAWLIRLTLAQHADVYPGITVTGLRPGFGSNRSRLTLSTSAGDSIIAGRVLDARGCGDALDSSATSATVLTFPQLMARMGTMFPLRGLRQAAVIGGGNSGLCAAESLLGIAPGHTSVAGLDYVDRVDLYATTLDGQSCDTFRESSRGRYMALAQSLAGNVSNPGTRLRIISQRASAASLPGGALVGDRAYDLAVLCTGLFRPELRDDLRYDTLDRAGYLNGVTGTASSEATLARMAAGFESYRIGAAADIRFSAAEEAAGITAIPASKVAMFRLGPRTAALASLLKPLS